MISMTAVMADDQIKPDQSCLSPVKRVVSGIFDFSLLKSVAFIPILASALLFYFGSFIS